MIRTSDLIHFDVRDFEQEQRRINNQLSALSKESGETKCQIAHELLAIVLNRNEKLARRAQAAFVLGGSAQALEINGSSEFSTSLSNAIDVEFLSKPGFESDYFNRRGGLEFQHPPLFLVLLQALTFSIIAIDQTRGSGVINKLRAEIENPQFQAWLGQILEREH